MFPLFGWQRYTVSGSASPGWESVRAEFEREFGLGRRCRAQCCVYHRGRRVVDLWGEAEDAKPEPGDKTYDGDALQVIWSNTKTLTAIAVASLVDRGLIEYEDKITKVWPEFGQNGKDDLRLEDVMRHESGLAWLEGRVDLEDLTTANLKAKNAMGKLLEKQTQHFPDDTRREYHAGTRGLILNEIFRRVDASGRTVGEYISQELHESLGADVFMGSLRESETRRLFSVKSWRPTYVMRMCAVPGFLSQRVCVGVSDFREVMGLDFQNKKTITDDGLEKAPKTLKNPAYIQAELPSLNGVASARGLAKVASAMADKGSFNQGKKRLMSEATWDKMHANPTVARDDGYDVKGMSPSNFAQGGINLFKVNDSDPADAQEKSRLRSGWAGWIGFGGAVLQWQPALSLGFGFASDLMAWYDVTNSSAARLQAEAAKCAREVEGVKSHL